MRVRRLITLLASLGLLFVMLPAAQAEQVTLTLLQAPDGIFDPYQLSVTPASGPSTTMWLNCDDYNDHVTLNESWIADVLYGWDTDGLLTTRMSQLNMTKSSPYYNPSYNAALAYDAKAWVELNYSAYGYNNEDLSYAVWQIFENINHGSDPLYQLAINHAIADAGNNNYGTYRQHLTIYTPDLNCSTCKPTGQGGTWTDGVPQEFNSVPDGGVTLMLLGGALVGLETLRRRFRV